MNFSYIEIFINVRIESTMPAKIKPARSSGVAGFRIILMLNAAKQLAILAIVLFSLGFRLP
jgi:hypothetical protein